MIPKCDDTAIRLERRLILDLNSKVNIAMVATYLLGIVNLSEIRLLGDLSTLGLCRGLSRTAGLRRISSSLNFLIFIVDSLCFFFIFIFIFVLPLAILVTVGAVLGDFGFVSGGGGFLLLGCWGTCANK